MPPNECANGMSAVAEGKDDGDEAVMAEVSTFDGTISTKERTEGSRALRISLAHSPARPLNVTDNRGLRGEWCLSSATSCFPSSSCCCPACWGDRKELCTR